MTLYEYFVENWKQEPYPVIDHTLRIDRLPSGDFHFYIHPYAHSGLTCDYIVSKDDIKERT